MKTQVKNNAYYENLSFEEAKREYNSCFDEKGIVIDNDKLFSVLHNKELFSYMFSDEKLLKNAQQDVNLKSKSASEKFLGKAFPPSWYWKMPDYYYPGLYVESNRTTVPDAEYDKTFASFQESLKVSLTVTRNEAVLNDCGWTRKKHDVPEYFNPEFPDLKIVFVKDNNTVKIFKIDPDTQKELGVFSLPFSLICGLFLKCREFEFDKPWQLRAHDYHDHRPNSFERKHHIIRDPETHEIISYGDWEPEEK